MRKPARQPERDRTLFDAAVASLHAEVAAFLHRASPDDLVLRGLVADLVATFHESGEMLPDEPALWQMSGARTGQKCNMINSAPVASIVANLSSASFMATATPGFSQSIRGTCYF